MTKKFLFLIFSVMAALFLIETSESIKENDFQDFAKISEYFPNSNNSSTTQTETTEPSTTTDPKPATNTITNPTTAPVVTKPKTTTSTSPAPAKPTEPTPVPKPSPITAEGVVSLTNRERAVKDLKALKANSALAAVAEGRLRDMEKYQYFAHESPSGQDAVALSESLGYKYFMLGENLARGDFTSSGKVVSGWMQSPGHRANILNPEYTEIGVAADYLEFNGHEQWMIVQIFGRQR